MAGFTYTAEVAIASELCSPEQQRYTFDGWEATGMQLDVGNSGVAAFVVPLGGGSITARFRPLGLPCSTRPSEQSATCAELEADGFKFKKSDTVCAMSVCDSVSWAEADARCAAFGARLCTGKELAANVAKGTGCSFDTQMVWTWDRCGAHMFQAAPGSSRLERAAECSSLDAQYAVRCCADLAPPSSIMTDTTTAAGGSPSTSTTTATTAADSSSTTPPAPVTTTVPSTTTAAVTAKSSSSTAPATTTAVPAPVGAQPGCLDEDRNCGYWAGQGLCTDERYRAQLVATCARSCGTCPGYVLPAMPPIADSNTTASAPTPTSTSTTARPETAPPESPVAEGPAQGDGVAAESQLRCAELGWTAHRKTSASLAERVCGSSPGCRDDATFSEAEAHCQGLGARLCTSAELAGAVARGTGCSFDVATVWAADRCSRWVGARRCCPAPKLMRATGQTRPRWPGAATKSTSSCARAPAIGTPCDVAPTTELWGYGGSMPG